MDIKKELDAWYKRINRPEFIPADPVRFPHRYMISAGGRRRETRRQDVEIAAFLAAVIAWGRRENIIRSAEGLFARMDPGPAAFVMSGNYRKLKDRCIHRTFFEEDLAYFCRGFRRCYEEYGSLESLFSSAMESSRVWDGIALFRETMAAGNGGRYTKHIANPAARSACKRINLALRWLVRREGPVDLGLWKSASPAALVIPLDLHAGRSARRLGLLERKADDRKAAEELTAKLRDFCPEDPAKYDLALFGMGVGRQ
jgi:uncharacterized protein (TIGR02757 family)